LASEAYHKKGIAIERKVRCLYAKVPKQSNSLDCGVYLIKYLETFLSNPDKYMDILLVNIYIYIYKKKKLKKNNRENIYI